MYRQRGSCWSVIAAQLPGRTDLAIKNYWNSTLKKKLPAMRTAAACPRLASSTSSHAGTPAWDLQLAAYGSEESSTAESSAVKPVLPCPTPVQVRPPVPVGATGQEQVSTVPVSEPVWIEQKPALVSQLSPEKKTPPPPPPAGDQTADWSMDLLCAPMSPIPLSVMDPLELACIYEFDDIDRFLPWFDHH
ncbi:hypothetical protein BS78_01G186800 [Paspalum vaginatum]|nr:hypothetical protein BS78_01G186800 [Paspalum vaginatum]